MDKIIYEWLLFTNSDKKIIDYILILSVKGLLISYQKLINCFDLIKSTDSLYGLNKYEFQIIKNSLKSYSSNNNIIKKDNELINSHGISCTTGHKFKFDCSIGIIIENNQNTISTPQQFHQQHKGTNGCDIREINILFFMVWRNIVIRNEILFHTRLYNIHYCKMVGLKIEDLISIKNYKYKSYMDKTEITEFHSNNIFTIQPNSIPSNVKEIKMYGSIQLSNGDKGTNGIQSSIPNSCEKLVLGINVSQRYYNGMFSNSITHLEFTDIRFNHSLKGKWLPSFLKCLIIKGTDFNQPIHKGDLPLSLIELHLNPTSYTGKIYPFSIPPLVKTLDYTFSPNKSNYRSIPISTINLTIQKPTTFNFYIKKGNIPHNVISIKFKGCCCNYIDSYSLPLSITSISFSNYYMEKLDKGTFPINLTYINMGDFDKPLPLNVFPISIKSIKFNNLNNQIPNGYFQKNVNLQILDLGYIYQFQINSKSLPPSLTSLYCENVNLINDDIHNISTITTLSILNFENIISLPCNLTTLSINDYTFNQDLSNLIQTTSIQSIYISPNNRDYINSMSSDFFYKYIKLINVDHDDDYNGDNF